MTQATDAAAASFAALTHKLITWTRRTSAAFARPIVSPTKPIWASFEPAASPTSRHPIAVAGLCADWKLDAQAIMAALMHDAMEDCGVTKLELIERFRAPQPKSWTA